MTTIIPTQGTPFLTQAEIATILRAMVIVREKVDAEDFLQDLEEFLLHDAVESAWKLKDLTLPNIKLRDLDSLERTVSHGSGERNPHYSFHGYPNELWVDLIEAALKEIIDDRTIWATVYNWGDLDITLSSSPPDDDDVWKDTVEAERAVGSLFRSGAR